MKKLVTLVVVAISMLLMTACGNKNTSEKIAEPNDTPEAGVYIGDLWQSDKNASGETFTAKTGAEAEETEAEEAEETEAETDKHLDDEHMNAIYEKLFKRFYAERVSDDPYELAGFLLMVDALDGIVPVPTKNRSLNAAVAVEIFHEDEDIHQEALKKAKELIAEGSFDCDNWGKLLKSKCKELRSDDFETYEEYEAYMELNYPSLATSADTGEPISSKPGEPWEGPTD